MVFDPTKNLIRVETEMNMNWAEANPELFTKKVREFMREFHEDNWKISLNRRGDHAFILVADKKPH